MTVHGLSGEWTPPGGGALCASAAGSRLIPQVCAGPSQPGFPSPVSQYLGTSSVKLVDPDPGLFAYETR